jgi:hypothetical protein
LNPKLPILFWCRLSRGEDCCGADAGRQFVGAVARPDKRDSRGGISHVARRLPEIEGSDSNGFNPRSLSA